MLSEQVQARFNEWMKYTDDSELLSELKTFSQILEEGDTQKIQSISDAFFQDLEFGTAGLRGVCGVGTNRMNCYTVARATQGLADYLVAHFDEPSVAIARDSRHKGEEFVRIAASVLAANKVKVFVYPRIEPTPALSFAVRDLGCSAGINMTASHNPSAYNGYKVYASDGCQITSLAAKEISERIACLAYFSEVGPAAKLMDYDQAQSEGMIKDIPEATLDGFVEAVLEQSQEDSTDKLNPLSLVYTPLCGTGLECVSRILEAIGLINITLVPEQSKADGNFPTCEYPNPEERAALEAGIALCYECKAQGDAPDLLLATDPDADRVGVACEDGDDYTLLSGNEMGILLMDFLASKALQRGEDLSNKLCVTTIVSAAMCDDLADYYGFELKRTLTGFKYIGEQIGLLEKAGEQDRFLFGFEESYGYLAGTHVRDKDAVVASMLICQMARWYKTQGLSLVQAMRALYQKFGWQTNRTISVSYPGEDGSIRMSQLMRDLRNRPPQSLAERRVIQAIDYASGVDGLPSAEVLEFRLEGGGKLIVRPSGTEPKIKAYLFAKGEDAQAADAMLKTLEAQARELLA